MAKISVCKGFEEMQAGESGLQIDDQKEVCMDHTSEFHWQWEEKRKLSLNGNIFVVPFSGSCLNNVSLTGLCVVYISDICLSQNVQHLKTITTAGFWLVKKVACEI